MALNMIDVLFTNVILAINRDSKECLHYSVSLHVYLLCLEQEIALYKFPIRTIQNHLHSFIIFLGIKVTFYIFLFKTHIRVSSYFYKQEQLNIFYYNHLTVNKRTGSVVKTMQGMKTVHAKKKREKIQAKSNKKNSIYSSSMDLLISQASP